MGTMNSPARGLRSQQTELAQLPPQRFRHMPGARRRTIEIAWCVRRLEIAPALERAPWARLDQYHLGAEHHSAAANALLVHERADGPDGLATHDLAADHPIERAAVGELGRPLGNHPGRVQVLARLAPLLTLFEPHADPVLEVLDRVAADAKLDEMQRHGGLSGGGRVSTAQALREERIAAT